MNKRYFGTDGIRGRVGEGVITPEFVLKLGWAAGRVFSEHSHDRILIGKDTRISGYMFESALEAGLSAAGVDSCLLGPMPTPAIAYLTKTFRACAGIVISASHNPHYDNGIKFFSANGTKLPDQAEMAIELFIDKQIKVVSSEELGKARRIADAPGRYIEFCKSTFPAFLDLRGINMVVDCGHGATYHVAPDVFTELGASVNAIGVSPDGININQDAGSTNLKQLQKTVVAQGADLGIAFDGDGDRLMMVDADGEIVDGDELIFIIAMHRMRHNLLKGGVVGTLMTNFGAELAFKEKGIPFLRANVGDRYVNALLEQNNWYLGGEGSGHILCRDKQSTGDGIVAALQVLGAIVESEQTLAQLKSGMTKLPQTMINVRLKEKIDLDTSDSIKAAVAQGEKRLGETGRVLLRPSGTEPVVRVMVEGQDKELVASVAEAIAEVVRQQVGT